MSCTIKSLKLQSSDGKLYETDCSNTETMLRIIQSIPSPKAEPLKRWLAKVGYERVKEVENPELAMERMRLLYEQKGYPKAWIEKRVRGIAVRQDLTKEWDERGAETGGHIFLSTSSRNIVQILLVCPNTLRAKSRRELLNIQLADSFAL